MSMNFKPRFEALENRLAMDASSLGAALPTRPSADPLPVLIVIADQRDFMKASSLQATANQSVVDPSNPNVVYIGSGSGGVWRTTEGGLNSSIHALPTRWDMPPK